MKRIKIFKAYFILWLFVYFIAVANLETFKTYFLSTLTFNIAIVTILAIGTFMLLKGAKDLVMMAGTFGVLMYKKDKLQFYLQGIEKVLPSTFATKIKTRIDSGMLLFTQQEKEDLLGWISETFANQNKYNNFFIGTVLMIGLLGTFAGLLGAIGSMGGIVKSLAGSNVDIGKIMAGFSGPLGSMAVGFGSSLFGVISAILLSIKGYLLNKAQASLLDGVENWLNARTVEHTDDGSIATVSQNKLEEGDKSILDLFLEKMDQFSKQLHAVAKSNQDAHVQIGQLTGMIHEDMQNHQTTLRQIEQRLQDWNSDRQAIQSQIGTQTDNLQKMMQMHHDVLTTIQRKEKQTETFISKVNQKDQLLAKMTSTLQQMQEKHDNERIAFFQTLERLEERDNILQKIYEKIDRNDPGQATEKQLYEIADLELDNMDFWSNHFQNRKGED